MFRTEPHGVVDPQCNGHRGRISAVSDHPLNSELTHCFWPPSFILEALEEAEEFLHLRVCKCALDHYGFIHKPPFLFSLGGCS